MNSGQVGIGQAATGRARVICLGGRVTEFLESLDWASTRGCAVRARSAAIVLSRSNNDSRHHRHGQRSAEERVRLERLLVIAGNAADHDARQTRGMLDCAARRFTARELSTGSRAACASAFAETNYQVAPNQSHRDDGVLAQKAF